MKILSKVGIELLWSDSLGAKSFSIALSLSHTNMSIVIDPGAAEMQPSYPLPKSVKAKLRSDALRRIVNACINAKVIIITHYHHDHYVRIDDKTVNNPHACYGQGKILIMKNPNTYINESQWARARTLIEGILSLRGKRIKDYTIKPVKNIAFEDPLNELPLALSRDYGDYAKRKSELIERGRKWFSKLVNELWLKREWVSDDILLDDGTKIVWGDGKTFSFQGVEIKILKPWFHGVEYDRTGWVTPVVIRKGGYIIFYSSDIMGPIIEDYAEFIIKEKPDIIFLDGPPTYLFPYMFNRINLRRAIENVIAIIKSKPRLIIYDHHLLRERKWRERIKEVFHEARKEQVDVLTVAECLGRKPLIDTM